MKMKRILALLLCFMMVVSLLPAGAITAFAETVSGNGRSLTLEKTTFTYGEAINVTAVGQGSDWVGIFRQTSDGSYESYSARWYNVTDANGVAYDISYGVAATEGGVSSDLTAGTYVVALILDGASGATGLSASTTLKQVITITEASSERSLSLEKTEFVYGEAINVTAVGEGTDWVGIFRHTDSGCEQFAARWYYVTTAGSGVSYNLWNASASDVSGISSSLTPGTYTVALILDDQSGSDGLASSTTQKVEITITEDDGSGSTVEGDGRSLSIEKFIYSYGEAINVTAVGEGTDWVGIFRQTSDGSHESYSARWYYVTDVGSGVSYNIWNGISATETGISASLTAGTYTIALILNNADSSTGFNASTTLKQVITITDAPLSPTSATYNPTNAKNGYATGTLVATIPEASGVSAIVKWANDSGELSDYSAGAKFKLNGTTATHTFGAHELIPAGATKLHVYSINDSTGTMSDSYVTVDLPENTVTRDPLASANRVSDTSMWIISDIHILNDNAGISCSYCGGTHYHDRNFATALQFAASFDNGAIGTFIVGDMVNDGESAQYSAMQSIIDGVSGLPRPYYVTGNHDYYGGITYATGTNMFFQYANIPSDASRPYTNAPSYAMTLGGYTFVMLSTDELPTYHTDPNGNITDGGMVDATLNQSTLNWLDSTLAACDGDTPVFVMLHQSLYNTIAGSLAGQNVNGVVNDSEVRAILAKYENVLFFNGHSHWTMNSASNMYDGTGTSLPIHAFNTSSTAYTWTDYTGTGVCDDGNEGYYVTIQDGCVYVLGCDFNEGKWLPAAQYCIELNNTCEEHTDEDRDHVCDACLATVGDHIDSANDGDHNCDWCGDGITACIDNDADDACDECGEGISESVSGYASGDLGSVSTDKTVYNVGDAINVTASSNSSSAWVALVRKTISGGYENGSVRWYYVSAANGTAFDITGANIGNYTGLTTTDIVAGKYLVVMTTANSILEMDLNASPYIEINVVCNHTDDNGDHVCDDCGNGATACYDPEGDGDHRCDVCGNVLEYSLCGDGDFDHECDECGVTLSECMDGTNDHLCDDCGARLSYCADNIGNDHRCDVCLDVISECADNDSDHTCDVCGNTVSTCADNDSDHICDVCGETLSTCADANKDHKCDICGTKLTDCEDNDSDHVCDVCGETLTACSDSDDHACDVCGETLSTCADGDGDGDCDVCGEILAVACEDKDNDHKCDDCGELLSHCIDVDGDYKCDICSSTMATGFESSAGLTFALNSDGKSYTATGMGSCGSDTVIIDLYNGLPVTHIANEAFDGVDFHTLRIGDNVKYIGEYAFSSNDALRLVVIGNGVETIAFRAFEDCADLGAINMVIGSGVKTIEKGATWVTDITNVYYASTASDWSKISIGEYNFGDTYGESLEEINLYYYSDVCPETSGNFWHWSNGSVAVYTDPEGSCVDDNSDDLCDICGRGFDGIVTIGGKLYYYENGKSAYKGLFEIDGELYFSDYDGSMATSYRWITNTGDTGLASGYYTFASDGKMAYNGIYTVDGASYYYENGKRAYKGLIEYGGEYYFAAENGKLVTETTCWITNTGDTGLSSGYYTFAADGKMITDGIYGGYYYENGKRVYKGLVEVDGEYYFAAENGKLVTDVRRWVSNANGTDITVGKFYTFTADGKMAYNGIYADSDGTLYYYENGLRTYKGLFELDGEYYFADHDGKIATSRRWVTNTGDTGYASGFYTFGEDGALVG